MKKYFPIMWRYVIDRLFYLLFIPAMYSMLSIAISLFVCMVIMQYNAIYFIDASEPFVFCFAILFVGRVIFEMLEFPFTKKAKKIDRLHFILRNMSSENELVLLDLIDKNKEVFE